MISANKCAMRVVRKILEDPESLGCIYTKMDCGANLIDMGVNAKGGFEAARLFVEADMAGLAIVQYGDFKLNEHYSFTKIEAWTEQPILACFASQVAGWKLGEGDYATIGSGPARTLAAVPSDRYFEAITYRDNHDEAVLCIQDPKLPSEEVAQYVADACHVKPENLYLLCCSNIDMVCSVEVSARMLESITHKMFGLGFDPEKIVAFRGSAPVPPIVNDQLVNMGRMNDSAIYGGEVEVWLDAEDADLARIIHRIASNTSNPYYGVPFVEIFKQSNYDFFQVDYDVWSIAKIQFHNVRTGRGFYAGEINYECLEKSFLMTTDQAEGRR